MENSQFSTLNSQLSTLNSALVALRAEMTLTGLDIFNAVIKKDLALASEKEHNFTICFMFMVADGSPRF